MEINKKTSTLAKELFRDNEVMKKMAMDRMKASVEISKINDEVCPFCGCNDFSVKVETLNIRCHHEVTLSCDSCNRKLAYTIRCLDAPEYTAYEKLLLKLQNLQLDVANDALGTQLKQEKENNKGVISLTDLIGEHLDAVHASTAPSVTITPWDGSAPTFTTKLNMLKEAEEGLFSKEFLKAMSEPVFEDEEAHSDWADVMKMHIEWAERQNELNKQKKIYISGKITGLDKRETRKKFNTAANDLLAKGFAPISPFDNGLPDGLSWEEYMVKDLEMLEDCDGIYLLKDWSESQGAKLERQVAIKLGMDIYEEQF